MQIFFLLDTFRQSCRLGLLILFILIGYPLTDSQADTGTYPYSFFVRLEVTETLTADCQMPCAAPQVEKVYLYLHGGFSMQGDKVVGKGEMEVRPETVCTVVAQKGGGSGSSCRIAGPKNGGFTVSGNLIDMVQVAGKAFAPKVSITLHPTQWPDLLVNFFLAIGGKAPFPVPVNHYQESYQTILQQSGVVEKPITVVAAHTENFVSDAIVAQISQKFSAKLEMPAPGFLRSINASGDFAFNKTPHGL